MSIVFYILIGILAYIIGSVPTGYLVVKKFTGKNILEHGTGNVGTMNTHRATNSKYLTILVLFGDILKGFIVYLSASYLLPVLNLDINLGLSLCGFAVILGHNYSIFLKFKGGKGLATALGFTLFFNPILILVWSLVFFIVTFLSKYMVLGQLVASALIPIFAYLYYINQFIIVLPFCLLVVIKHAPRLKSVINKTEPKMYYKIR